MRKTVTLEALSAPEAGRKSGAFVPAAALNPRQREAVEHTEGPLLVLAAAGTGKTRVVTHRVAGLLGRGVEPKRIVALSFTNKAAEEMRDRLERMVGPEIASKLVLSTFHSLGARMLREDPKAFGLSSSRFSILDQGDTYGLVRSLLREHGYHGAEGERRFDQGAVVSRISLWKNDLLTAADMGDTRRKDEYDDIAAALFGPYEDRLRMLGAVDFDDLVVRIARGLRDDATARRRWQRKFTYVMVDEYQDTNRAQLEVLRHLVAGHNNLCVVGDDDQAIYGWRGANVANILGFDMMFAGTHVVRLEQNYRSRPPILAGANQVIAHVTSRHEKRLAATRRGGKPIVLAVARDGGHEARWVGKQIFDLIGRQRVGGANVAVLYRSALQSRPIEAELKEHAIGYRVLGGQALYDKREVKDALAYLKVLVTPRDELAVRRALETPARGIGHRTMERLAEFARAQGVSLLDAVLRSSEVEGIGPQPARALAGFAAHVRAARGAMRTERSAAIAARQLIDAVGLRNAIRKDTGSDKATETRWSGIELLLSGVSRYEGRVRNRGQKPRYGEYLSNLAMDSRELDDEREAGGVVTLATLHSAKGLEWDHVFVIGCEEGTMPHRRVDAPKKSDAVAGDLDEERRLMYVAITRARERLWLVRAQARSERGREVPRTPSRFLEPLQGDHVEHYEIDVAEEVTTEAAEAMASELLARLDARES